MMFTNIKRAFPDRLIGLRVGKPLNQSAAMQRAADWDALEARSLRHRGAMLKNFGLADRPRPTMRCDALVALFTVSLGRVAVPRHRQLTQQKQTRSGPVTLHRRQRDAEIGGDVRAPSTQKLHVHDLSLPIAGCREFHGALGSTSRSSSVRTLRGRSRPDAGGYSPVAPSTRSHAGFHRSGQTLRHRPAYGGVACARVVDHVAHHARG